MTLSSDLNIILSAKLLNGKVLFQDLSFSLIINLFLKCYLSSCVLEFILFIFCLNVLTQVSKFILNLLYLRLECLKVFIRSTSLIEAVDFFWVLYFSIENFDLCFYLKDFFVSLFQLEGKCDVLYLLWFKLIHCYLNLFLVFGWHFFTFFLKLINFFLWWCFTILIYLDLLIFALLNKLFKFVYS